MTNGSRGRLRGQAGSPAGSHGVLSRSLCARHLPTTFLLPIRAVSGACDLLILAAFHPELAPLRVALGDAMRGYVGSVLVVARAVGIGLPMAAAAGAMHLAEVQPRAVLAIGTCGAYPGSGLGVGAVVVARRVRLVDPSALHGASQFPGPMSVVTDTHAPMADAICRAAGVPPAEVATTLGITVDDATAARIAQATGAQVEHLEAHGVATACAARGIPFGAVLAVANHVGARARDEWLLHHHAAARAAANVVLTWMERGALPWTSP
jgi:futalosine hydrolase